ncbi:MAG: metal-dependent transcriptional regulator [Dehalococcoidaceae bacterium]|nr:metal-dependent transcriptional regulator [Dehalococcoidaceae bacterium]
MVKRHSSSIEDYLEAIMLASLEGSKVTVTQISQVMGVKKPSVTSAIARLLEMGMVAHEKYGEIVLTEKGSRVAQDVYVRHQALRRFLVEILNVDEEVATDDACRMEHYLSSTSVDRLNKFIEFVMDCPQGRPIWLDGFNYFVSHGHRNPEQMLICSSRCNVRDKLTNNDE